jgi:hypothetical protein
MARWTAFEGLPVHELANLEYNDSGFSLGIFAQVAYAQHNMSFSYVGLRSG